jgi:hypothetical protein
MIMMIMILTMIIMVIIMIIMVLIMIDIGWLILDVKVYNCVNITDFKLHKVYENGLKSVKHKCNMGIHIYNHKVIHIL